MIKKMLAIAAVLFATTAVSAGEPSASDRASSLIELARAGRHVTQLEAQTFWYSMLRKEVKAKADAVWAAKQAKYNARKAKYAENAPYYFGIVQINDEWDKFRYISRNFDAYNSRAPGRHLVRVRRGIPFELPDRNLSRLEYLRQYANRYAQSYNLGLRGDTGTKRLPYYDRHLIMYRY